MYYYTFLLDFKFPILNPTAVPALTFYVYNFNKI